MKNYSSPPRPPVFQKPPPAKPEMSPVLVFFLKGIGGIILFLFAINFFFRTGDKDSSRGFIADAILTWIASDDNSKVDDLITQAESEFLKKNIGNSISLLEKALKVDPSSVKVLVYLSSLHRHLEDFKLADAYIDKAIVLSPKNSHLYAIKSLIYFDSFEYEKAEFYLNIAIKIDPNDPQVREIQSKLNDLDL